MVSFAIPHSSLFMSAHHRPQQCRSDARLSTYSGAPSLQPSLALTSDTTSHRSSDQRYSSRFSDQQPLSQRTIFENHWSRASHLRGGSSISNSNHNHNNHNNTASIGSTSATMNANLNATTAYSTPSAANSSLTLSATDDPMTADLRCFANVFDRMSDKRADKQRFVMSSHKTDEFSKIALGAKVERALARRMSGQDAVFTNGGSAASKRRTHADEEKRALELAA